MFSYGAMPVLERMVEFTGARQELIAHNIANLSTPYFKPTDLDPVQFQAQLRDAMDQRSRKPNGMRRDLELGSTSQVRVRRGQMEFRPQRTNENILFHDQNNRDVERTMQDLVENALAHRTSVELLKSQFDLLRTAIRERV
ncbi:MAG: flagellar basal body rod protein FlgB [Phycisphaeraceae bacterium]|nr:flagellar basal body rod protein FlgB [Phycisphaeraceae bacterium]